MKKELKKKTFVTVINAGVVVAAKAILSKEQFEKASANKGSVVRLLNDANVKLWFIDNDKPPYNLGIRSVAREKVSSDAVVKEEERIKDVLDQLIEQIDKFPAHDSAENKSEEAEEATKEANNVAPGDDVPSDDNEKFIRSLAKDVEISLKHHFGEDVEYALFVSAGSCVGIDSTIHPLKIIHMMAYAAQNQ